MAEVEVRECASAEDEALSLAICNATRTSTSVRTALTVSVSLSVKPSVGYLAHVRPHSPPRARQPQRERRAALADVGSWLGTLPARLALEVEDAISAASERSGYDPTAVERAFHAKFWAAEPERGEREPALYRTRELDHSIDL